MKNLKLMMVGLLLLVFMVPNAMAAKSEKMGYVDLSRLFDEFHKTKEYDKVLEEKHKEFEGVAKEKMEKIREAQGKLALLKDDQKEELEEEIKMMQTELLEFDRQEKLNLNNERQEKIRDILLEIEKIVSTYAENQGYTVILNDRVLIFGDQSMNITEDVLKELNQ